MLITMPKTFDQLVSMLNKAAVPDNHQAHITRIYLNKKKKPTPWVLSYPDYHGPRHLTYHNRQGQRVTPQYHTLRGTAQATVCRAVAQGRLPSLKRNMVPCADCRAAEILPPVPLGQARATIYHHWDYRRPLAVSPLCATCHHERGPARPLPGAIFWSKKQNPKLKSSSHAMRERLQEFLAAR